MAVDIFTTEPFHMPISEEDVSPIAMASESVYRQLRVTSYSANIGISNPPPGSPGSPTIVVASSVVGVSGIGKQSGSRGLMDLGIAPSRIQLIWISIKEQPVCGPTPICHGSVIPTGGNLPATKPFSIGRTGKDLLISDVRE